MENEARTHTLADLRAWSRPGVDLAVLGHPIKHSLSPAMHNAALNVLAAREPGFHAWRYHRFDIAPDDLPEALALLHAKKFRGINLTVPHKILALASPLVTAIDPAARPVGAVNTLRWHPDGWEGFNTDGHGMAAGLRQDLGIELTDTPVILLGAGGAARGAAVACLAGGVSSLWIGNRSQQNLHALLSLLGPLAGEIPVHGFEPARPPSELPPASLVINATSAGLHREDPLPIDLDLLPAPRAVYDMIYNPAETALLARARSLGLPAANGLSMLVHQGGSALALWTGASVPIDAMQAAATAALVGR
jgi:shikimate dehydrogenase